MSPVMLSTEHPQAPLRFAKCPAADPDLEPIEGVLTAVDHTLMRDREIEPAALGALQG
jgi:hypothetical protein